jgi:hypothetical protein
MFEMTAAHGGVLSVARDEDHLEILSSHADGLSQLTPVHASRQADIGYQEGNIRVGIDDFDGGRRVASFKNIVAVFRQDFGHMRTVPSSSTIKTVSPAP